MEKKPLLIEIALAGPGIWNVKERTGLTAESVSPVPFDQESLDDICRKIVAHFHDSHADAAVKPGYFQRLGGELAQMVLPSSLREKLVENTGPVEFFLDETAVSLPVELFPAGETVLAEAGPVSRHWLSSGRVIAPSKGFPKASRNVLIVSDPGKDLPDARREGLAILLKFKAAGKSWNRYYLGPSTTRKALDGEFYRADLLHLAAHYDNSAPPEKTGIRLDDGIWMPPTGCGFPSPSLVFANCCRAAHPGGSGGADKLSLAGEFLRQGTRDVVAPYLPVRDDVAKSFAEEFYASFLSGRPPAIAVWEARKKVGPAGWMYWHFGCVPADALEQGGKGERADRTGAYALAIAAVLLLAALGAYYFRDRSSASEAVLVQEGDSASSRAAVEPPPVTAETATGITERATPSQPGQTGSVPRSLTDSHSSMPERREGEASRSAVRGQKGETIRFSGNLHDF